MFGVLSRCTSRRSIGLVTDGRRAAVCVIRISPLGRRILTHEVHDCGGEPVVETLRRILQPWIPPRKGKRPAPGPWVQLGIPDTQSSQVVVPITQANRNATAQAYFLEAVQATNVRAEDRVIDLVRLEVDRQPLACVATSPTAAVNGLVDMVSGLGARVGLIQPAPAALFRAGASHARAPRGSKLCARFFLGTRQAIGVLGAGDQPLFWQALQIPQGQEMTALMSAYSTLWMLRRNARVGVPIDTVIVHGRPELDLGQAAEEFRRRTGARLLRSDEPGYSMMSAAMGLALTDPLSDEPRHDLARGLKPQPLIGDVFPWGELVLHGALLGGVSLFLSASASHVGARLRAVEAEMAAFPWVKGMDQAKLDAEKKLLEERIKAIGTFRGSRVAWSVPLRKMAAAVPAGTVIKKLSGDAEVETGARTGAGKAKKRLEVQFETPMAGDGSLPREMEGFLASLRAEDSIKRHFPLIAVANLKANPATARGTPTTQYSIVCQPRADKGKAKAAR